MNVQDVLRGLQDRIDSNDCVVPVDVMSEWLITLEAAMRELEEEIEWMREELMKNLQAQAEQGGGVEFNSDGSIKDVD